MSGQKYYITVAVPTFSESSEAVSFFLFQLGATGCEERDALVIGYFPDQDVENLREKMASALEQIRTRGLALPVQKVEIARLPEQNWRASWHRYFKPIFIGGRLVIRPPWETVDLQPNWPEIVLEPRQAFGTGNHATTKLMLDAIVARADNLPGSALDIGTGSGILAFAHMRLQPEATVVVCDLDPVAIEHAVENAESNHLAKNLCAFVGSIDALCAGKKQFPVIYANLQRHLILPILAQMENLLAANGELLLSGILATEQDQIVAALAGLQLTAKSIEHLEEWVRIDVVKEKICE